MNPFLARFNERRRNKRLIRIECDRAIEAKKLDPELTLIELLLKQKEVLTEHLDKVNNNINKLRISEENKVEDKK